MCMMNPDKNLMLFLKDQGSSENAHMAVYEVKNKACKLKASYTERNVCPRNSQPFGVSYVAGRRHGKLYLGCRNKKNYVVKRSVQWGSGQYTGMFGGKPPKTTTTTTILPVTLETWTFPEGLSWTSKKKGKTIRKEEIMETGTGHRGLADANSQRVSTKYGASLRIGKQPFWLI